MELVGLEQLVDISKVFVRYDFYGADFRTIDNKTSVVSKESWKTVCGAEQIINMKQKQKRP